MGPGDDPLAVANIGKAAHIAAAAPGGPRYVASMTSNERSSIDNAIWLCSNCATMIDVAPEAYPISLLHEWKHQAEHAADLEKGKALPSHNDARNQLVAALSGMPVPFTTTAIQNVHGATEAALHALDPRFRIETSFSNKVTTYTVHALEQVDFKVRIPASLAEEWQAAMQDLIDHGRDAKLPAAGIRLKGSPLLEKMFSDNGLHDSQLRVESHKKPALQKLKLIDPDTQRVEPFDDLVGQVVFGRKSATFEGSACGGMFLMSLNISWAQACAYTTVELSVNFDQWEKCDLRYLPHFDKLLRLFELLAAGWEADIALEIAGLPVLQAKGSMPGESDSIRATHAHLRFIAFVRTIARHIDASIFFAANSPISQADFLRAMEAADIIEGRQVYRREKLESNVACTIIAQDGASNIQFLISSEHPSAFIVQADDEGQIVAFGQTIQLPKLEIRLDGVHPKVQHVDLSTIKDGDAVQVEFEPSDDFRCSLRYLKTEEELLVTHSREPENPSS